MFLHTGTTVKKVSWSKAKKAASVGPWWRPGGNIKRVSIRLNDIEDDDGDINDDPWIFGEEEMILNEEAVESRRESSGKT